MIQNTSTIAITVSHLKKTYGNVKAVEDVSFVVNEGEIFGLLGPNGAGKTTTVECITGLRRPDEGAITVLGLDPQTRSECAPSRCRSPIAVQYLSRQVESQEILDMYRSSTKIRPSQKNLSAHSGSAKN